MDGSTGFLDLPIPSVQRPRARDLITDSFAGGGGASTGIEMGLGRSPDIAINHDPKALSMHAANHPNTRHIINSIYAIDPADLVQPGQRIGLAWFSPDCTHHSKAKGGKPLESGRRDLAHVVVHWAQRVRPRVIMLENVEEFLDWGPLTPDHRPDPARKGETFRAWVHALKREGYRVEWQVLRACDYGAPTIRKRLFLIARSDGQPIVWPAPTHGPRDSDAVREGLLEPWPSAASIIDWSQPCPSIFDTSAQIMEKHGLRALRPLGDNTLRRVAAGLKRYVLDDAAPFFVSYAQHGGRNRSADDPLHTVTASAKDQNMVVAAFLAQHNTQRGGPNPGKAARDPLATLTTRGTQTQLVAAHMVNMHGTGRSARSPADPLTAICAGGTHAGLIAAFLTKYYGQGDGQSLNDPMHTLTTRDRMGLVTLQIGDTPYVIADIGMRMLHPREMFCAQGFPDSYIIDRGADGTRLTKTEQVRMCGNSVAPMIPAILAPANCPDLVEARP